MSNGTMLNAADFTAAIDEIIEYLKTGDQNRQALMHANLLLTNLMCLLRPMLNRTKEGDLSRRSITAPTRRDLEWTKVREVKEIVIGGVSEIERGEHSAAR